MKEVAAFLQHCKPFYLATMDGDKPQVRPFGALCEFEDKLLSYHDEQKSRVSSDEAESECSHLRYV